MEAPRLTQFATSCHCSGSFSELISFLEQVSPGTNNHLTEGNTPKPSGCVPPAPTAAELLKPLMCSFSSTRRLCFTAPCLCMCWVLIIV